MLSFSSIENESLSNIVSFQGGEGFMLKRSVHLMLQSAMVLMLSFVSLLARFWVKAVCWMG
jgi:hypothetical protein